MSIDGKWNATIHTPMGKQNALLTMTLGESQVVTGTLNWEGKDLHLFDASFDGTNLKWSAQVTQPMRLKVRFKGTVDGDSIKGTAKPGIFPASNVEAVRA